MSKDLLQKNKNAWLNVVLCCAFVVHHLVIQRIAFTLSGLPGCAHDFAFTMVVIHVTSGASVVGSKSQNEDNLTFWEDLHGYLTTILTWVDCPMRLSVWANVCPSQSLALPTFSGFSCPEEFSPIEIPNEDGSVMLSCMPASHADQNPQRKTIVVIPGMFNTSSMRFVVQSPKSATNGM
jgi:hypothetical protein